VSISRRQIQQTLQDVLRQATDEQLLAHARELRARGCGWRYDGLGEWSTADIFAQLRKMGIDAEEAGFRQQAQDAGRPERLKQRWRGDREWDDFPWDDFPLLAAEELWRRLTPDLVCPELVADAVASHISSMNAAEAGPATKEEVEGDLAAALEVISYLEQVPPSERPARYEELAECSLHDIGDWLRDLVFGIAAEHAEAATHIIDVMMECDSGNAADYDGDLALALAGAGHSDAALERVHLTLERWPNEPWVQVNAAQVYEKLARNDEALALYLDALRGTDDEWTWDAADEGVRDLLKKLRREGEYEAIVREHPRPIEDESFDAEDQFEDEDLVDAWPPLPGESPGGSAAIDLGDDWTPVGEPLRAGPKVGRNDPCPCGSGKKYKRCCLGKGGNKK
jgi:tetratricopeptide (TPR) repeat protein